MSHLTLEGVSAHYDKSAPPILKDVSLELTDGELMVVLGPSGSGKTTLLNLIAGFAAPSAGRIALDGRSITGPGADRSVVFQNNALLPWQDVITNVAFSLQLAGVGKREREHHASELLRKVGLAGFERRDIWELSGGQKQRVGLARALASKPALLLLDEPFGALDAFTREQMQELLLAIWRDNRSPVLLITHDIEEAVFLATDLVLLATHPGRVAERLRVDFSRRYASGESARSIKSDPRFIETREHVLAQVFSEQSRSIA